MSEFTDSMQRRPAAAGVAQRGALRDLALLADDVADARSSSLAMRSLSSMTSFSVSAILPATPVVVHRHAYAEVALFDGQEPEEQQLVVDGRPSVVGSLLPSPLIRSSWSCACAIVLLQGWARRAGRGEHVGVDRLDQVRVEAGLERAAAIFGLAVAGHGDQPSRVRTAGFAEAPGDAVAVDAPAARCRGARRRAVPVARLRDRVRPVVGDGDLVPLELEQLLAASRACPRCRRRSGCAAARSWLARRGAGSALHARRPAAAVWLVDSASGQARR